MGKQISVAIAVMALVTASNAIATTAEYWVTHTGDNGAGSLRHALIEANREAGPARIRFDSVNGPFAVPQTIKMTRDLPPITDDVEINGYIPDRLWKPTGVTVDGAGRHRLFQVAAGAQVRLRYFTVTGGKAALGGAIASAGETRVENMMLRGNNAEHGGGIAQTGGKVWLVNSSLLENRASRRGGGLFVGAGEAAVTHCTVTANFAERGAGIYSKDTLRLANNIIALNQWGADCEGEQPPAVGSAHNLIMQSIQCGKPRFTADPRLDRAGRYNGPTQSIPLLAKSPALNQGNNALSVDPDGNPLKWDQRGNGDPRFADGIADLGAFERQGQLDMKVDTTKDNDLRGCASGGPDCSLRGAIAIANASSRHSSIRFDRSLGPGRVELFLDTALPRIRRSLTLRAEKGVEVVIHGQGGTLETEEGVDIMLDRVTFKH